MATYAFEYLVGAMRRAWKEFPGERSANNRNLFMVGFAKAIREQMAEAFKMRSEALVPVFDRYIEDTFGIVKTTERKAQCDTAQPGATGALLDGYEAGQAAGIRGGIPDRGGERTLNLTN